MADFGYDEGVGASEASPQLADAGFPPQIAHFPPRIKNASADTPPRMSADSLLVMRVRFLVHGN